MASIFGFGLKEPPFVTLHSTPLFEIRKYAPYFVAEVPFEGKIGDGKSFHILAQYIGVYPGKPMNEQAKRIEMTVPVIVDFKIGGGSPEVVAPDEESMSFVLPLEYMHLDQIPAPLDKRINLKLVSGRVIASRRFSGRFNVPFGLKQFTILMKALKEDKLIAADTDDSTIAWSVAQYNPPYTLPFLRRNEIWVDIGGEDTMQGDRKKTDELIKLLIRGEENDVKQG